MSEENYLDLQGRSDISEMNVNEQDASDDEIDENDHLIMLGLESNNKKLIDKANKVAKVKKILLEKEDEYRGQILHIETITMMAKYQLIYIKLENFIKKLERIVRIKNQNCKISTFFAIRKAFPSKIKNKKYIAMKFISGVTTLNRVISLKFERDKSFAFSNIVTRKLLEKKFVVKRTEISTLKEKVDKCEKDLEYVLSQVKESQQQKLKPTRSKHDTTNSNNNEIAIGISKLKEVEVNNQRLSHKLKCTEHKIISFIDEISEIFSSQEIFKNLYPAPRSANKKVPRKA